jgi:Bacterial mobilisation protein (MobC)
MGRPKKAPEERRGNSPNPRMTVAEKAEAEQNAAILSYRLPAALAVQRHQAAQAVALLRIGVNFNQIAHHMNAGREVPPDLSTLIAGVNALLDQIYGPGDNGGRARL